MYYVDVPLVNKLYEINRTPKAVDFGKYVLTNALERYILKTVPQMFQLDLFIKYD
jgi:hypothetical protein